MATTDPILLDIIDRLKPDLESAGLTRTRGGQARGIAWAEASGRDSLSSWFELRIHRHGIPEPRLSAGLLEYQPLSRGGRTVVRGERSLALPWPSSSPPPTDLMVDTIRSWLAPLAPARECAVCCEAIGPSDVAAEVCIPPSTDSFVVHAACATREMEPA